MASPELQALVAMLRSSPVVASGSLEDGRKGLDAMSAMFPPPADVRFEAGVASGVVIERAIPPGADPERTLLYLHGGGYVMGSLTSHRQLAASVAKAAGIATVSVAYRLAPEHPFPAAIEDATAVYRWLLAQGSQPGRIAILGDSAGGGLTVATLLALKAAGVPLPGAAVCLSPWVDLECTGASMASRAAVDPMLSKGMLLGMAAAYLAGADPKSPLASPLHGDLAGLPPLLIQVGTAETLHDDAVRLHARALAAAVDVTLEPWEDMIHVWHAFPMLPEAQRAVARIGEFVRAHLGVRAG